MRERYELFVATPSPDLVEMVGAAGLDLVLEGAADLSQSLGVPWQTRHPDVVAAVRRVHAACVRAGVEFAPRRSGRAQARGGSTGSGPVMSS